MIVSDVTKLAEVYFKTKISGVEKGWILLERLIKLIKWVVDWVR